MTAIHTQTVQETHRARQEPDPRRGRRPRRHRQRRPLRRRRSTSPPVRRRPSATRTTVRFSSCRAGRRHLHRPHRRRRWRRSPSTASRSTRPTPSTARASQLPGLRPSKRARRRRHRRLHEHRRGPAPLRRPGRRRGLPLLAVRGAPTPAGCSRSSSSPTSRRPSRFTVTAPAHWKVVSNSPTPEPHRRRGDGVDARPGPSRRPRACPPTSPPSSPARTTWSATRCRPARGTVPLGIFCRRSLLRAPRRRQHLRLHEAGLRLLRERSSTSAYPFEKYDQIFTPEYNMGAMENAGAVTFTEVYVFRAKVTEAIDRAPRADDPARARPHVVRQPRDDEVVGRPLAQRVVRRVGVDDVPGRGHRVDERVDDVRHVREGLGLPPGPAVLDAPDRGRHPRPRGRRGQLRRHHLRQGRLGAQAARRLRRP